MKDLPTAESTEALIMASGRQTRASLREQLKQIGTGEVPETTRSPDPESSDEDDDIEGSQSPPRVHRYTRGQAAKRKGAANLRSHREAKKSRFVDFGDSPPSSPVQAPAQPTNDQTNRNVALSQLLFPPSSPVSNVAPVAKNPAGERRKLWFKEDLPESSQEGSSSASQTHAADGGSSSQSSSSEEDWIPPTRPVSLE
jgi:hypothetical protein